MSGNFTCWLCTRSRKDWLDFRPLAEEEKVTLESVRAKYQEGKCSSQFTGLPAVLLGNGETPMKNRDMESCQGEPDYLLHHRTGLIKTYLFWAIVNALSAKDKELLRRKFEEVFGWVSFMEYMDGYNWHLVLLRWHDVVLPFVKNYKTEYSLVRYHLLEILAITAHDYVCNSMSRRVLSLALHAHCLALRLIMIDMYKREIFTGEVSLFAHQVWEHLPIAFETKDVADHVAQRLEAVFKDMKRIIATCTDKKHYTPTIIERDYYTRRRNTRFPANGKNTEVRHSSHFTDYRKMNPIGNVMIPGYIVEKNKDGLKSYLEVVLAGGSFQYKIEEDFGYKDDDLVFYVVEKSCTLPGIYLSIERSFGSIPSPGPIRTEDQEYKTMDTMSLGDVRILYTEGRANELSGLTVMKLKSILNQVCKLPVSGKKGVLIDRIIVFMKQRFGEVRSNSNLSFFQPASRTLGTSSIPTNRSDKWPSGELCSDMFDESACVPCAGHTLNELRTSIDSAISFCWRCFDIERDSLQEGCQVKAAKPRDLTSIEIGEEASNHILGQSKNPWLISLSTNILWCLYFSCKLVMMEKKKIAVVGEVNLEKLKDKLIVDATSIEAAKKSGVVGGKARAFSECASEILVPGVPACALTKRILVISPNTIAGRSLMDIEGKDRERDNSGAIISFGSFPQWQSSFDAVFPTEREVQQLLSSLTEHINS